MTPPDPPFSPAHYRRLLADLEACIARRARAERELAEEGPPEDDPEVAHLRRSVERLEAIGRWMDVNGESIYGTSASPIGAPGWGRCTRRGSTLYLHVFDWPDDGRLRVPVSGGVRSARVLGTREPLKVETGNDRAVVTLPPAPVDPVVTVVALETEGEPRPVSHR